MRRLGYLSLQERIWEPGTKAKVEWLFPGAPHQKLMLLVLTSLKGLHKMTFAWVVQANDNDCHIPGRGKEKLLKGTNLLMLRLRILFFLHVWSLVCNSLNSCIIKSPTTVAGVVWLPLPNPPRMHIPPPPAPPPTPSVSRMIILSQLDSQSCTCCLITSQMCRGHLSLVELEADTWEVIPNWVRKSSRKLTFVLLLWPFDETSRQSKVGTWFSLLLKY